MGIRECVHGHVDSSLVCESPLLLEWPLTGRNWHRRFVGAKNQHNWLQMGRAQLDLLQKMGMKPAHSLLDVGCGSLRLGHLAIEYLDKGKYAGVDISEKLIRAGMNKELKRGWKNKKPRFYVTDDLIMPKGKFDYAMAQSVFTHMDSEKIEICIRNVLGALKTDGRFYATYNWGKHIVDNIKYPDMSEFPTYHIRMLVGIAGGFMTHIGKWGIPQNKRNHQLLVLIMSKK